MTSDDDKQEDFALFRKTMADTNRKHRNYREQRHPPHESASMPPIKIRQAELPADAPDTNVMIDETYGDFIEFARGGLQKKILQQLKRGDLGFTTTLDLHGYTTAQADRLLTTFLTHAYNTGNPNALIIHGKGLHSESNGVLKHFTTNWLKQQSTVKAFCSAQPKDGGTGAVYVLLRVKTGR